MKSHNLLEYIKEKFSNYQNYYEILGVDPSRATDEVIKNAYDDKCRQLKGMLKGYESEAIQEIRELIQTTLDDAYSALKTENSRKHYRDLLRTINTSSETIEAKEEKDEENEL